jgi:serpin B
MEDRMNCTVNRASTFVIAFAAVTATSLAVLMPHGALAQNQVSDRALTDAYNASGQELFKLLSGSAGNIVFSPYSIGTAMAMALSGARAATEAEMAAVLKHHRERAAIDAANADVMAVLNGYDHSATPPLCPPGMRLSGQRCEIAPMADNRCPFGTRREGELCWGGAKFAPSAKLLTANALMLTRPGDLVSKEYAALLQDKYAAEVFQGAKLGDINGWVRRKTEGKIDKILEQLDPQSVAVLLNAVYFKARWASTFDVKSTKNDAFNLSRSHKVQVPTMHRAGSYALAARRGYRAIRLPYEVRALGMVIVLPDEIDGLGEVSRRIDANEMSELFAALRGGQAERPVDLAMPRFKSEFKTMLKEPFRRAGMMLAFDADRADFSGIIGGPVSDANRVYVSDIWHRAMIEVAEESTEAAAATAVEFIARAARPRPTPPEPFHVDRPFLFLIVDDATGAILFQGRTVDPR